MINKKILFLIICLQSLLTSLNALNIDNQKILILNSYHKGFPWTDNIVEGIESTLISDLDKLEITVEYMDTKSQGYDEEYKTFLYNFYTHKYKNNDFDLIIVSDDNALDFIREYKNTLFSNVPVVACGINNPTVSTIIDPEIYTGIVETSSHIKTINLILKLHPNTKSIKLIIDKSLSGNYLWSQIETDLSNYKDITFERISDDYNITETKNILKNQKDDSIVIFFTLSRDLSKNNYSLKEGVLLVTSNSNRPVYSTHSQNLPFGVIGGNMISGFHQGETVANIASRILDGESVSKIPFILESPTKYIFNYSQLKKWKIDISNLPDNSVVIDKPESYILKYKYYILGVGIFIIFLILLIIFLYRINIKNKEIQRSLTNLTVAIEKAEVSIMITDNKGFVEYTNPYFSDLTGYSKEEILGQNPNLLKTDTHQSDFYEKMWNTINTGNTWKGEFCNQKKDGERFWEKAIITPIFNEDKIITSYVAIKTDITGEKKIEESLRQSQKMEAIGQLAGGIAHDFNNMLTGIMGCTEIITTKVKNNPEIKRFTDLIMDSSMQAAELSQKLLSFSRKAESVNNFFDIHTSISKTCSILERSINKSIIIRYKLDANISIINGDSSSIENSLLNLGINARDIMPNGGELTFSTRNVQFNESNKSPNLNIPNGHYIEIDVQDTGDGMTKELQSRIFEPFFTTKAIGKGTGLGLSIVYKTIKENNGCITVYSEVGYGSIFKVFLPVVMDQPIIKESQEQELIHGNGTILIADDESVVRLVFSQMLNDLGYDVIIAKDGKECIDIYKDKGTKIDLVILDMVMPNMNGKDTFYKLKTINPNIKTIICSGFSMDINIENLIKDGLSGFIQKPYKQLVISKIIGKILSQ